MSAEGDILTRVLSTSSRPCHHFSPLANCLHVLNAVRDMTIVSPRHAPMPCLVPVSTNTSERMLNSRPHD